MDVDPDATDDGGQPGHGGDAEPPEPTGVGRPTMAADAHLALDPATCDWIVDRLTAILEVMRSESRAVEPRIARVSIRVVDDHAMDEAHRRWCDLPGTTDVLTFRSESESGLEIDLLLCRDEAARRAADFDHGIDHELLLYAVHGILHCLGFDDHEDEARARMHREEDRLLEAIGVGAVYRPEGAA